MNKYFSLNILIILLLTLNSQRLFAQDEKYFVDVELSNSSPLKTEEVIISYKLKYKGNSINLVNPRFNISKLDFGDHFKVLRQGQNRNMNFDRSGSITIFEYQFVLQPIKTGSYTVAPFTIQFDEKQFKSKPVTVRVLESNAPAQISQADKIFIDARVSKSKPWKGEEFYLTYKLYSKYELYNLSELIPPTVDGFSATLLDIDDQGRSKIEKINGEQYYTMLLYKAQLYPLHSGEYYVDPFEGTVTAKVPTGRRVRDFWGSRAEVKLQSIPLKSQKLKIGVKELPTAGKPIDFHGAVGEFDLSTSLDLTETKTGEPLTLRIVVSGKGNLKLLAEPDLKLPPGFESYEPQIKNRGNSKTYEYLLIPSKPGTFELQPYAFSYFDTKKGKYINLESSIYNVTVNQGEVFTSSSGGAGVSKEDVARLAEDIRFLTPEVPQFGAIRKPFFGSGMFYFGLAAPFLFAIPLFLVGRRQRALAGDVALTRNRKARKLAEKRFKSALAFVKQNDKKAFYDELVRAIWGYLTDKFAIDPSNLSRAHIQKVMTEKGVSPDNVEGLVSLLDRGEMALYAPLSEGALESDYDSAVSLLEAIDTELSK